MEYIIKTTIGGGNNLAQAPELRVKNLEDALDVIEIESCNDYGKPFGPGFKLELEVVE